MTTGSEPAERPRQRVLPAPTWESDAFWKGGFDGQLLIHSCRRCGRFFHPPAAACWRCRSTDVGPRPASGLAVVAAVSVNEHQWHPGFEPPYAVAIVELDDEPDVRLTTNIVGCAPGDVRIGMSVTVCFEDWDDVSIPVFRPLEEGRR
ncbi:MAG: OB-fold domain-containing protein [Acidimicrobiaceae bacterium]|nr:OB-fold domain-containing protein [Acidimicrobiaceae bacterium]